MFSSQKIREIVEQGLEDAEVKVTDLTGTSDHFEVQVVSSAFSGKNALERHRMVYGLFGAAVGGEIHALSVKAQTPEEAGG